jgi:aminoglycoside phosphotransferase (APT) family kinase protein
MAGTIERDLTAWLGEELRDPGLRIDGLRRTSVGYSRENWVFDAAWQADGKSQAQAFIARRDPAGSVLETDRRLEFAILSALADTNVLVPKVRWLDADGVRLGRPSIVMDLADGVCDYMALNGDRPLERRLAIAHRLYDRLADIHRLDWRALGLDKVLENPGNKAALAALVYWEAELRRVQLEPEPELELVIAWLRERAPANDVVTLVHGDFKPGNVLMQGDEVTVVLDWETAHLGDPLEDIGWVTNPLRAGEHRIPGAWEPSDLIARWSERTGFAADPAAVRWWNVLANFKQAMTVLTGKHAFADGRFDRILHEPVAIYRLLFNLIEA